MLKFKGIITLIICVCLGVGVSQYSVQASTQEEKPDYSEKGLEYFIRTDTQTVSVKITGKPVNVVIPETVVIAEQTYTVTHIKSTAIKHDTLVRDKLKKVARDDKEYEKNKKTQTIQIPKTVISIETGSFSYFSKLKKITVAPENSKYKSTAKGLLSKDGTILYQAVNGTGTYKAPKGVKKIAARAFVATNYKKVVLPDSCNTIGSRAFFKCKKLQKIKGNGLSKCGKYAFYGTKVKGTNRYGTMKFKI